MKLFNLDTSKLSLGLSGFGEPANSQRDWTMLVLVNLVILALIGVFGVRIFLQVDALEFADTTTTSDQNQTLTINRSDLKEAVANFQKNRASFDLLRNRQPDIPNPVR